MDWLLPSYNWLSSHEWIYDGVICNTRSEDPVGAYWIASMPRRSDITNSVSRRHFLSLRLTNVCMWRNLNILPPSVKHAGKTSPYMDIADTVCVGACRALPNELYESRWGRRQSLELRTKNLNCPAATEVLPALESCRRWWLTYWEQYDWWAYESIASFSVTMSEDETSS